MGRKLAAAVSKPNHAHGSGGAPKAAQLLDCLRPADVLLVDANSRAARAIKYLTQSSWSHAALFVGRRLAAISGGAEHRFVEADMLAGVRGTGIDQYAGLHVRICRPIGLSVDEADAVCDHAIARLGHQYDLRNVFDLARYLITTPPAPASIRRRMLALGSGDPTRAICSTLIAQAFQSIRYPILPDASLQAANRPDCPGCMDEILHIRHHSLFAPRDFDVSPYFEIIKPHAPANFDFRQMRWGD